jgi:hypothetical protein
MLPIVMGGTTAGIAATFSGKKRKLSAEIQSKTS